MITGAHSILYSTDPEADRGFLKDVLGLLHVDVGVYQPRHARPRSPSPAKAGRARRSASRQKAAPRPRVRGKAAGRKRARGSQR